MSDVINAAGADAAPLSFEEALQKYDPVMGFEVHVELNTASKMFSSAPNAFGDEPNTNVNEVDLGLPGTLPVVNGKAVESAIKLGLALNCSIAEYCRFARKQYFYPDLPKNWQTSQYDEPIAYDGWLDIELDDGEIFRVEIERAHMEEDAGKLTHAGTSGRIQGADYSLVDYNRTGVPLIEIVTKPITGAGARAPELARAYVSAIRDLVKALDISDARMERGNVRCDANVSLSPKGSGVFGTRSETKNVNSMRAVEHAVHFEIRRHAGILSAGGSIVQETRHWQETTRTTSSGRPKSDADDYRYFPEPDLVPIVTTSEWIEKLRAELPEPPAQRRRRLREAWGYTDPEFRDVVAAGLLDEIEQTVAQGASPAVARKWWMGEISRLANARSVEPAELGVEPATIVELNQLIEDGRINDKIARQVLEHHLDGEGSPAQIVQDRGLEVVSDDGALTAAVEKAMEENPDVVEKVAGGKLKAIGALIGPVMKETRGQADAARVREIVLQKLGIEG
ncbi:Asp-tRNA(Asn)/Glu-tRNA(Gln) amidotransferase subunit GatB [Nesterenkonia sp.]|uniref:Asp-tRNA(Asn)/Glu-tRNA(Gln) amidotransferase subunit GatB n=1 Tax=Nesterenkonia sp. TaxID=704201 RepID=UPI002623C8A1|nr:Asp-tRNA(Asn)/Glu-tRNA(Gln) amidotransferase subunit GatB [Nesterenkonia sp.]